MNTERLLAAVSLLRDAAAASWDECPNESVSRRKYIEGRRDALDNVLWLIRNMAREENPPPDRTDVLPMSPQGGPS